MKKLNLKEFEKKIAARPLNSDDYEAVTDMQLQYFPGMLPCCAGRNNRKDYPSF